MYRTVIDNLIASALEVWSLLTVDALYAKLESAKSNDASVNGELRPSNVHREPTTTDEATANFVKQKTNKTCFDFAKPGGCKRANCSFQHVAAKPKEEARPGAAEKKENLQDKPCRRCGELGHWHKQCRYKWCGGGHKEELCFRKKNGQ